MAYEELRTLNNREGTTFDNLKTHVIYAEDMNKIKGNLDYLKGEIEEVGTIPTKTSDLENDSGFITTADIPTIPTATSDLENDSGFITTADIPTIPTATSDLENDSGFITTADIPTIPTATSDLENDSGFITEHIPNHLDTLTIWKALGSAIKALSPIDISFVQSYSLTSQRLYFYPFVNTYNGSLTGVNFIPSNNANYTGNNYNGIGLYSYSGGTLTRIAMTTNASNFWVNTSGALVSKAFSAPVNVTSGLYYVAFLYSNSSQTTAPNLYGYTPAYITRFLTMDFTNSAMMSGYIASQTSLPTTQAMSGLTAVSTNHWFALY